MNFVINVDPERVIGQANEVVVQVHMPSGKWMDFDGDLLYREVRRQDGRTFVALVYEAVDFDEVTP